MATTRIHTGTIYFEKENGSGGYEERIKLGSQQKISIKKSTEKKEGYSNDEELNQVVDEIVTKTTYEFSTEIGDLNADALAIAFKGAIVSGTYKAGDSFAGREIIADTAAAKIGDPIIHSGALYIAKEDFAAGAFDEDKCTPSRSLVYVRVEAEKGTHAVGRITVDGINQANNKATLLHIPRIRLAFDGDFAFSSSEIIRLALAGKLLKKDGEPIFTLDDEG